MSFSPAVAASYAANFRPVGPVSGFENVLSTAGTDLMSKIPFEKAAVKLGMARQALGEAAATDRQKMSLDYQLDRAREIDRANKKAGALRMAMDVFGGFGSETPQVAAVDPMALLDQLEGFTRTQELRRGERMRRSTAAAATGMNELSQM